MEYIALYRKYRPKTFDEIIGQNSIVTILKNQIIMDKIAHAYLFCGTRGTGKTSAAKIFAKAVNCSNHVQGNPCNSCEVCDNIDSNQVMDIMEIDAASNRGVDEIRELREKVKYPPTLGKYKVYIIDEVHMLTQEAFNALLKTLEEPPSHVLFILATTEPHKLPATILSRCQRYNFKRIELSDIVSRMKFICESQSIIIDEKTMMLIARNADGAMRDALSILEQCISSNVSGQVDYDYVRDMLGLTNEGSIFDLAEKIILEDVKSALEIIEKVYENGNEMTQLMNQLIMCFRDVLVYHISTGFKQHYDVNEEYAKRLMELGSRVPREKFISYIESLTQMENKMKYSGLPKIIMEVAVIKLCETDNNGVNSDSHVSKNKNVKPIERKISNNHHHLDNNAENVIKDSKESNINEGNKKNKEDSIDSLNINWELICKNISMEKPLLASALQMGKLKGIKDNVIIITFNHQDTIHMMSANKNKSFIETIINKMYNKEMFIQFDNEESKDEAFIKLSKSLFGEDKVKIIED